jgi:hypothetical protein
MTNAGWKIITLENLKKNTELFFAISRFPWECCRSVSERSPRARDESTNSEVNVSSDLYLASY